MELIIIHKHITFSG